MNFVNLTLNFCLRSQHVWKKASVPFFLIFLTLSTVINEKYFRFWSVIPVKIMIEFCKFNFKLLLKTLQHSSFLVSGYKIFISAGPLSISTPSRITKTPLVAPLPDEKQKASNLSVSLHPSKPETIVEDGVANSYYNPNPPKSRIAHKRSDKDVSSKFPIKPIPPPQSSKPLLKVKEKKPAAISKVLVPPTKTGRADSGTGAGNTARARLLETGLSIEVSKD